MTVKVMFHYNDLNSSNNQPTGWSETVYWLTGTDLSVATVAARNLNFARVQMFGRGVKHVGTVLSNPAILGDSVRDVGLAFPSNSLVYNPVWGTGLAEDIPADFAYSSFMTRVQMGSTYHRPYWLSGNADGVQVDTLGLINDPAWLSAYAAWAALMTSGIWGSPVIGREPGDAPITPIINIAGDGTITANGHGLAANDMVLLHGLKFSPATTKIHGYFRVSTVPTANTFQLWNFPGIGTSIYIGGGTVRKKVVLYKAYTDLTRIGFRKKNRGRPFGLSVGRRRTRR